MVSSISISETNVLSEESGCKACDRLTTVSIGRFYTHASAVWRTWGDHRES